MVGAEMAVGMVAEREEVLQNVQVEYRQSKLSNLPHP